MAVGIIRQVEVILAGTHVWFNTLTFSVVTDIRRFVVTDIRRFVVTDIRRFALFRLKFTKNLRPL